MDELSLRVLTAQARRSVDVVVISAPGSNGCLKSFWGRERVSDGENLRVWTQRTQWKHQMRWVTPTEFIHAPKCGELMKKLEKSSQSKHRYLCGKPEERKPRREEISLWFHYNSREITMFIAPISRIRVSGLNRSPLSRWKGHVIYTSSICWIRLQSPALFKHLTAYLWGS